MVLQGKSILDVTKTLNAEGIPTTNGKKWLKTTIHTMLSHEAYTGTVVWGAKAKDGAPPVRVEDAHPAIVSKRDFQKARRLLGSRAPKKVNPRRASSPYLLSGIAKCETCGKAMTAAEAKSGKYTYYICHSLLKRGKGTCKTPRLNAKSFEKLIVNEIRAPQIPHLDKRKTLLEPDAMRGKMFCCTDKPSPTRCTHYEARLTGVPVRRGEEYDGYDSIVGADDVRGVDARSGFEVVGGAPRGSAGRWSGLDGQPDNHVADTAEPGRR